MQGSLSSEDVIRILDEVIWSREQRVGELWRWGYEFDLGEPHRWQAGMLRGYWLAPPDEFKQIAPRFDELRETIRGLDIVREVESEPYEITEDSGLGGPYLGEKWRIHFSQRIVYTHRDP